jgi:hypothetical protein
MALSSLLVGHKKISSQPRTKLKIEESADNTHHSDRATPTVKRTLLF